MAGLLRQFVDTFVELARPKLVGGTEFKDKPELALLASSTKGEMGTHTLRSVREGKAWLRDTLIHMGYRDQCDLEPKSLTAGAIRKAYAYRGKHSEDQVVQTTHP